MASLLALVLLAQSAPTTTPVSRQDRLIRPEPPPNRKLCKVPKPVPGEQFVVFGVNGGSAVSASTIAGLDEETTTGNIKIMPGREPLFLVLTSSHPMIFRLSGAVSRLQKVVVLHHVGGGVTGVPQTKVAFGIGRPCDVGHDFLTRVSPYSIAGLESIFGERPDAIGGAYQLHRATLDGRSFHSEDAPRFKYGRRRTKLQINEVTFYPGGTTKIPSGSIQSSRPAIPYHILPSTAGAAQLEREGTIVRMPDDEAQAFEGRLTEMHGFERARRLFSGDYYQVTRPIELPIGLCGGQSLTFVVPAQWYLTGDPCHSNILQTNGAIVSVP